MENYIKTAIRYAEGKMSGGDLRLNRLPSLCFAMASIAAD